jgi:hypothetical protein
MSVPEAAMNEYHPMKTGEDNIRRARQVRCVDSEAVAASPDERAQQQFGARILAPNARHDLASLCRRNTIHLMVAIIR